MWSAQKEGSALLRRYQQQRGSTPSKNDVSLDKSASQETGLNAPGFLDPVTDGSELGHAYQERRREQSEMSPRASRGLSQKLFSDGDGDFNSPSVSMSRPPRDEQSGTSHSSDAYTQAAVTRALAQLSEMQSSSHNLEESEFGASLNKVTGILKSLVQSGKSAPSSSTKDSYGRVASPRTPANLTAISHLKTPILDRSSTNAPGLKSVLKVYMDNQLEQNEAEMAYYEDVVNELASRLDEMTEDRDRCAEKASGLQEELDAMTSSCAHLGERLQKLADQKEKEIASLQTDLEILQKENASLDSSVKSLESRLESASRRARLEIEELGAQLKASSLNATKDKTEMQKKIRELEEELRDSGVEIDSLNSKLETYRLETSTSTRSDDRFHALVSELAEKKTALVSFEARVESLQARINELNQVNTVLSQQLQGSADPVVGVTSRSPVYRTPRTKGSSLLLSPRGEVSRVDISIAGQRSVLKNYMHNQMDLNQAEMDQYETYIDALADQLDSVTAERDELKERLTKFTSSSPSEIPREDDASLQESLAAKIDELEKLRQELSALHSEQHLGIANDQVLQLEEELFETRKKLESCEYDLELKDEELSKTEAALAEIQSQFEEVSSVIRSTQQAHAKHREGEVLELHRQVIKLKTALDEENVAKTSLQHQIEELRDLVDAQKAKVATANSQLLEAMRSAEHEAARVLSLTLQLEEKGRLADSAQKELQALKRLLPEDHSSSIGSPRKAGFIAVATHQELLNRAEEAKDLMGEELQTLRNQIAVLSAAKDASSRQLEEAAAEVDVLRSRYLHADTELQLLKDEHDVAAEKFQLTVQDLSQKLQLASISNAELETQLSSSRNRCDAVNKESQQLKEAISVLQSEIRALKVDRERLAAEVDRFSDDLAEKMAELDSVKNRTDDIARTHEDAMDDILSENKSLKIRNQELSEESADYKSQRDSIRKELQESVRHLKQKSDLLAEEKEELNNAVARQKELLAKYEQAASLTRQSMNNDSKTRRRLAEVINDHASKMASCEEGLRTQVTAWFDVYENRIESLAKHIAAENRNLSGFANREKSMRAELESQIVYLNRELVATLRKAEAEGAARVELANKLELSQKEQEELEKSLEEVRMENEINLSNATAAITADEIARLEERVRDAEQRAAEYSSGGARAFAQSSRTIAFLEGECSRLNSLVDHFRAVNCKLMEDLKESHEESLQMRSLENRLKISLEAEAALEKRVSEVEAALRAKEKEMLRALHSAQDSEQARVGDLRKEINELGDRLKLTQEKNQSLIKELSLERSNKEVLLQQQDDLSSELNEKIEFRTKECNELLLQLEEAKKSYTVARGQLRDREDRLIEVEGLLRQQRRENEMTDEARQRQRLLLEDEVREQVERVAELEYLIQELRASLSETESSNALKDEVIASSLAKQAAASDEIRMLRGRLELSSADVSALTEATEELRSQLDEATAALESTSAAFEEFKSGQHKLIGDRLSELDHTYSQLSQEAEQMRSELKKTKALLTSTSETLSQTEKKSLSLQSSLALSEGQVLALQSSVASSQSENKNLRDQLEDVSSRLSSYSKEISQLKGALIESEMTCESHVKKIRDLETLVELQKADNGETSKASSLLASELRLICDSLLEGAGGPTGPSRPGNNTGASDLFSSPVPVHHHRGKLDSPDDSVEDRNTHGARLKGSMQVAKELRQRVESVMGQLAKSRELLKHARKEVADQKKVVDHLEQKVHLLELDKDGLKAQLEVDEEDLRASRAEVGSLAAEREELFVSAEELAERIRVVMKGMDHSLSQGVSRANVVTAGKVMVRSPSEVASSPGQQLVLSQRDNSVNNMDFGVTSMLSATAKEVDRTIHSLCNALEIVVQEATNKKTLVEKTEAMLMDRERGWTKERSGLQERIASLEASVQRETELYEKSQLDLQSTATELEKLKILLAEFSRNNADLELEYKNSNENVEGLKSALSDAESLIQELQSRNRSLQLESDRKSEEMRNLSENFDSLRRRSSETELHLERISAAAERLRSERDAFEGIRRSMEAEFERSRLEVASLKLHAKTAEEENRSSFEMEKLLASLGTTMDYISSNFAMGSQASSQDEPNFLALSPIATRLRSTEGSSGAATIAARVESSVKRLGELRNWSRDESRSRRKLEEKAETALAELAQTQSELDETTAQFKKVVTTASERGAECKEKAKEISELQVALIKRQEEVERLKRETLNLQDQWNDEKTSKKKLLAESQSKDSEIAQLKLENEGTQSSILKLQAQLTATRDRLQEVSSLAEQRAESLRSCKASNARLSASLELLEQGLDRDKSDRGALEQKLLQVEATASTASKLRTQLSELESAMAFSKEQAIVATREKETAERLLFQATHDLEACKKKLAQTEKKLESAVRECESSQVDCDSLRSAVSKLGSQLDAEHARLVQSEFALEKLQSELVSRPKIDNYVAFASDIENEQLRHSSEVATLKQELHKLQQEIQSKSSLLAEEQAQSSKLEAEVAALRQKLHKTAQEVDASNERAGALRTEGRRARETVLEAAAMMWEVVNMIRSDAHTAGVEMLTPIKDPRSELKEDGKSSRLGLEDALGLPQLVEALDSLREGAEWMRQQPKARIEMESNIRRLESEKQRLQRELSHAESKSEEAMARLRAEVQTMHSQLAELSRADGPRSHAHSLRQISNLEQSLRQEREEAEKTNETVSLLRKQVDRGAAEIAKLQKEIVALQSGPNQSVLLSDIKTTKDGLERSQQECQSLKKELKAVNHHRGVLRETVEQLERNLLQKLDNADKLALREPRHGKAVEDEEFLKRQVARLRARSTAMEELASIYRAGVLALYPDGASFGAAQYAGSDDGLGVGWIENEIIVVRQSYEEELRLYNAEVVELRNKLRQSEAYVGELRKRFEENMKSMYLPSGRSQSAEGLLREFEQLSITLENAEDEIQGLNQELAKARNDSRKRHSDLVNECTKALQARDAALNAVKRLEACCKDAGMENVAIYENLLSQLGVSSDSRGVETLTTHAELLEEDFLTGKHHSRSRAKQDRNRDNDSLRRVFSTSNTAAAAGMRLLEEEEERERLAEQIQRERQELQRKRKDNLTQSRRRELLTEETSHHYNGASGDKKSVTSPGSPDLFTAKSSHLTTRIIPPERDSGVDAVTGAIGIHRPYSTNGAGEFTSYPLTTTESGTGFGSLRVSRALQQGHTPTFLHQQSRQRPLRTDDRDSELANLLERSGSRPSSRSSSNARGSHR